MPRSASDRRERGTVLLERARLPRRSDETRAHDAVAIDHECGPIRVAAIFEERAVVAGDLPVRPEIGEQ